MAGRGFRYGRRSDTVKVKQFPRAWSGTIKELHHTNMALNIDGLLIPCGLETYKEVRKQFRVGDVVECTMFPWGQIKTIQKVEGPNNA